MISIRKYHGPLAALVALGAVAGVAPAAQASTQAGSVTVRLGYHHDPFGNEDALLDAGLVCAGLTVGLYRADGVREASAVTNANGTATFPAITEGFRYAVRFDSSGCSNVSGPTTLIGAADQVGTASWSYVVDSDAHLAITTLVGAGDADAEGLDDWYETHVSMTSPTSADTDGDGRTDDAELGSSIWSDPLKVDTDGDGYTDYVEVWGEAFPCGDYPGWNSADPNDKIEHPSIDVPSWGKKIGRARVGRTIRIGAIQPCSGVTVATQWYVKNKALHYGGTGRDLKLTKQMRAKPVSVRVTMSYPGFLSESKKLGFGRVKARR